MLWIAAAYIYAALVKIVSLTAGSPPQIDAIDPPSKIYFFTRFDAECMHGWGGSDAMVDGHLACEGLTDTSIDLGL